MPAWLGRGPVQDDARQERATSPLPPLRRCSSPWGRMVTVDRLGGAHRVLIQYARLCVPGDLGVAPVPAIMTGRGELFDLARVVQEVVWGDAQEDHDRWCAGWGDVGDGADRAVGAEVGDPPVARRRATPKTSRPSSWCSPGTQARMASGPWPWPQPWARPRSRPRSRLEAKCSWATEISRPPIVPRAGAGQRRPPAGPSRRCSREEPVGAPLGSLLIQPVQCRAEVAGRILQGAADPESVRGSGSPPRRTRRAAWAAAVRRTPGSACAGPWLRRRRCTRRKPPVFVLAERSPYRAPTPGAARD